MKYTSKWSPEATWPMNESSLICSVWLMPYRCLLPKTHRLPKIAQSNTLLEECQAKPVHLDHFLYPRDFINICHFNFDTTFLYLIIKGLNLIFNWNIKHAITEFMSKQAHFSGLFLRFICRQYLSQMKNTSTFNWPGNCLTLFFFIISSSCFDKYIIWELLQM